MISVLCLAHTILFLTLITPIPGDYNLHRSYWTNLDECHLIVARSLVDEQPIHGDCMPMGWGMNGSHNEIGMLM